MRLPLRTLALLSVLALGTLAVTPAVRADMDRPSWTAGDFWVYAVSGSNYGISGAGTFRMDVLGLDTANVAGTDYQCFRARLQLNASGSGAVFNGGDAWYRVSDLALVMQTYNVTFDIPFFGMVTIITTVSFAPPLRIAWPISTGGNWTVSGDVITVQQVLPFGPGSSTNPFSFDFDVMAPATVTVPAGTFETTPIQISSSGQTNAYWSPQAGNYARQQEFNSGGGQVSSQELTSYRYQGPSLLGLPVIVWLLLLLLIVIVVVAMILKRRNRPMAAMPPQYPPPQP